MRTSTATDRKFVQAKPNTFSKKRPGELLTVDEWLAETAREFPFLFMPSNGRGTPSAAKRWRWRRHGRCAGAS